MPKWIQSPVPDETGHYPLIPADEYERPRLNKGPYIHGDFKSFVSPIDGNTINDRGQLRRHNEQHGVTNSSDYSDNFIKERAYRRESAGKKDLEKSRLHDINAAIAQHGG